METPTFAVLLLVISLYCVPSIWRTFLHNRKLRSIPAVGPSGTLTSYIGAIRLFFHGQEMVQEGYNKFRGSLFKIPTLTSWTVVVTGGKLIDEIRRSPEEALSAYEANKEVMILYTLVVFKPANRQSVKFLKTDLTIGLEHHRDPFHVEVIKRPLTMNIGARLADVQERPLRIISLQRKEVITCHESFFVSQLAIEWTRITAYPTIMDIVCRASNRMFVGLPLCRDPDWLALNKNFTIDLVKSGRFLNFVPSALRPLAASLMRSVSNGIKRGTKHLEPFLRERFEQEAKYGEDWPERPNDMVTWMLEVTKDRQRSVQSLVIAVLVTNFAAIHTTTMAFTYTMYELATRPEYVKPLRDEIEAVTKEEGWSKDSIRKLRKVDSFIKESLRLSNFALVTMSRKALRDFTFSDGTTIPAGSTMAVPFNGVNTDANDYSDPSVFDGFRFEKLREQDGESMKHQITSLGVDYILFGNGRHACPGRFFVANELKVMLAHVVMNYDVKMADGKGRPRNWQFGFRRAPDTTAQILFRKRHAPTS
ncbi:Cytochrome P450 [Amanita muscaria]